MAVSDFITNIITDPFFIVSALFWVIVYILKSLFSRERDNITIFFPLYAMFRTRKLNEWLHRVGKKYAKFWRVFFTIGIFVSLGILVYSVYFFTRNLIQLFTSPAPENAIQPMIPGVTVEFSIFSYLILPLLFCITFHEFAHAMASEADNLSVKSTGLIGGGLFYLVLSGAFVEPDEFQINSRKTSSWTRLRIFSAGTFVNAIQAGLAFLLVINFTAIVSPFYGPQVFQIETVLSDGEGGYNQGSIFPGDKVIEINGTKIDVSDNVGLTQILNNETSIKCSVGDTLSLKVIDSDDQEQTRTIYLGNHLFVGFTHVYKNETHLEVTEVFSKYQGGNNYDRLETGMEFKAIDGYCFNFTENKTLDRYLRDHGSPGLTNLTMSNEENISIYLDYWPLVLGAFEFRNFYVGAFFEVDGNSVTVEKVLSNLTETGNNEGNLYPGDRITHVNGAVVDLTSYDTFEAFLLDEIGPVDDFMTVEFTVIPKNGEESVIRDVNLQPIPKSYVFVGVQSSPYWLPKNWFGSLLGSDFAIWLERELLYFYMIAFSLSLFNMLPLLIPPLDGYHMMKEGVVNLIGHNYATRKKKKLSFRFNPEESEYRLEIHNIVEIQKVDIEVSSEDGECLYDSLPFRAKDTIDDGYYDTISFNYEGIKLPPEGTVITVTVELLADTKAKLKKAIYMSIGGIIFVLVLLNFIFSYLFVGNITFWI